MRVKRAQKALHQTVGDVVAALLFKKVGSSGRKGVSPADQRSWVVLSATSSWIYYVWRLCEKVRVLNFAWYYKGGTSKKMSPVQNLYGRKETRCSIRGVHSRKFRLNLGHISSWISIYFRQGLTKFVFLISLKIQISMGVFELKTADTHRRFKLQLCVWLLPCFGETLN